MFGNITGQVVAVAANPYAVTMLILVVFRVQEVFCLPSWHVYGKPALILVVDNRTGADSRLE